MTRIQVTPLDLRQFFFIDNFFLCTHVRHDAYTVEWSILGFSPVRQKKKK